MQSLAFELRMNRLKRTLAEQKQRIDRAMNNAAELRLLQMETGKLTAGTPLHQLIEDMGRLVKLEERRYHKTLQQLKCLGWDEEKDNADTEKYALCRFSIAHTHVAFVL
jgi:hypothetical protein